LAGTLPKAVASDQNGTEMLGRASEQQALHRLLARARSGQSGVLVIRGEAGVGKTALLEYLAEQASGCQVAHVTGAQAEMELAFSALQQLLAPVLAPLENLPVPQREAMEVAFGQRSGPAPDLFLREPIQDHTLAGLPELVVGGLADHDARRLLASVIRGRFDDHVMDRIVAEARGNPLALLELPRGPSIGELAGGFGVSPARPVIARLEQSFLQRMRLLPAPTQRLMLLAAAEPVGDPRVLLSAAERLGLGLEAAAPAEAAGLLEIDTRVRFGHPLVRSAIYAEATLADRQAAHRALAEATDPESDPDRRVWHRAHAALEPDEELAADLERSAGRAQSRGGLAAAAAFLERAAVLTPDRAARARRSLAAAEANFLAGSPEAALALLDTALSGPLNALDGALVAQLRGRIALHCGRSGEAAALLLDAAGQLEPLEPRVARDTREAALYAATLAGRLGGRISETAATIRAAPPPTGPPRAADLLMDGLTLRFTRGFAASAPLLKRALRAYREEEPGPQRDLRWPWLAVRTAADTFDNDSWDALATRYVQIARDTGALSVLAIGLMFLGLLRIVEGKLDAAAALVEETESLIEATGSGRIVLSKLMLAAWQGDEAHATELMTTTEREATTRGQGMVLTFSEHARAVLYNSLGKYKLALAAAQQATEHDELSTSSWALPELIEAASRSGRPELGADALTRLRTRTQAAGTAWALGVEARSAALLSDGPIAEELYREGISRLEECGFVAGIARAHLLYGEWLRRERRRLDARDQLRLAQDMFTDMGAKAFADRAGRELLATGETARKRTPDAGDELTPHETRIARMARDGASNREIADQLFVSRKTIEYHLHNIFLKLGITSREHLDRVLPSG
jgi:DNA-binding CsgD family transcriptional regulator